MGVGVIFLMVTVHLILGVVWLVGIGAGVPPAFAEAGETPALLPWEVGLRDPRQPGRRLAVVRLCNRALGTSGGQFQSFRHQGRRYGHILDPRSGRPAEGVLSATVVAPTAALADALSTAFYVMGPQPSLAYCKTHPEIGMIMLCPGSHATEVEIHRAGLADDELVMRTDRSCAEQRADPPSRQA